MIFKGSLYATAQISQEQGLKGYVDASLLSHQCPLQGTELFRGLPPDELEVVIDGFERSEHKRGTVLSNRGQPCTNIAILRMGELATTGKPLMEIGGFAYCGEETLRVRLPQKDLNPLNALQKDAEVRFLDIGLYQLCWLSLLKLTHFTSL